MSNIEFLSKLLNYGHEIKSVLIDTSFLIRLLKKENDLYQNAQDYFKYFRENKIDVYLSSIVIGEYCVKDKIESIPLKFFKQISFDLRDAKFSGIFTGILLKDKDLRENTERILIKEDCKLISQVYTRNINAYITKDVSSLNKIIKPIQAVYTDFIFEFIDLNMPLSSFLNMLPLEIPKK